jgi:hypothetical protein
MVGGPLRATHRQAQGDLPPYEEKSGCHAEPVEA